MKHGEDEGNVLAPLDGVFPQGVKLSPHRRTDRTYQSSDDDHQNISRDPGCIVAVFQFVPLKIDPLGNVGRVVGLDSVLVENHGRDESRKIRMEIECRIGIDSSLCRNR